MPRPHQSCARPGQVRVGSVGRLASTSIFSYSGLLPQAKLKESVHAPWLASVRRGRMACTTHNFSHDGAQMSTFVQEERMLELYPYPFAHVRLDKWPTRVGLDYTSSY